MFSFSQELLQTHQYEMNEKQEKLLKMKENFKKLKEKFQLQTDDDMDVTRFSDEPLNNNDKNAIADQQAKIQDYQVEIVNLHQKLKEKDNTIKVNHFSFKILF